MMVTGPGPVRLQPMGVGETLDAAIRLYRSSWRSLMGVVAVVTIPFTVIQAFAVNAAQDPYVIGDRTYVRATGGGTILLFVALNLLIVTPLLQGAIVRSVAGIYLGERPAAGRSLRFALSKFWPLLLGLFLMSLLVGLGFVALVIPGVILYVRYHFLVESVVVEGQSGSGALGRSWRLTKGAFWRIFWTLLLAWIIGAVAATILQIPAIIVGVNGSMATTAWVVRAVFSSIAQVIVTPFSATVGVLLYFDARIRKEAFDLAAMAREVGASVP